VAVTIASCVAVIYYWDYISPLQNYGYLGAFFFGFLAGSSLPLPLPYLVVTFTLGGVLNPALVGVASGLGAGIGGTLVYLFGRGGSKLLPKFGLLPPDPNQPPSPKVARLLDWAHRRGSLVVFLMSAMLNPAFAPMAITMGALRFRLAKFFLWCSAGNIVKSLFIAFCGYFGLGTLLRWLEVF
jgi:membrane protein DedA with SNARE-associated domain